MVSHVQLTLWQQLWHYWHGTTMAQYLSQHHGMEPLLTLYGMLGRTVRKMVSTLWYHYGMVPLYAI